MVSCDDQKPVLDVGAAALADVKRKDPDRDESEKWGDFGNYMVWKKRKLAAQFQDAAGEIVPEAGENLSSIFNGISIYVNGNTDPSADELRRLMMLHGGQYHIYYSSRSTSHIIASNLPYTKIVKLTPDEKVVKPQWITDSIAANRLLPWRNYELYPLHERNGNASANKSPSKAVQPPKPIAPHAAVAKTPQTAHKAGDPNYIDQFYSRSRLHHLSLWKNESKDLVRKLQEQHPGHFPGRTGLKESIGVRPSSSTSGTVIMHIDFDCFFVSVGILSRPFLAGKPVAVCHGRSGKGKINENEDETMFNSRSEVSSCSYSARKAGVKNGMYLGQAKQLCPDLKTIPYDFEKYKEISTIFYQTVAEFTLDMEAISCDEMFIDCTEVLQETGVAPLEFASFLRSEIFSRTKCTTSAGMGANPLLARLATKKAKPNGQFHIDPRMASDFMLEIPVSDLPGVGYSAVEKLTALKVETCADLQNLPLSTLQKEFGPKTGQKLFNISRGIDDHIVKNTCVRKSVSVDVNYGIRMKEVEEFNRFFRDISKEAEKRMKAAGVVGETITLKLLVRHPSAPIDPPKYMGTGHCNAFNKSVTLMGPTDSHEIIAREGISLFRKMNIDVKELRGIGVQITRLTVLPKKPTAEEMAAARSSIRPSLPSPKKQTTLTELATEGTKDTLFSDLQLNDEQLSANQPKVGQINHEGDGLNHRYEKHEHAEEPYEDWIGDEDGGLDENPVINPDRIVKLDDKPPIGYDLIADVGWDRAAEEAAVRLKDVLELEENRHFRVDGFRASAKRAAGNFLSQAIPFQETSPVEEADNALTIRRNEEKLDEIGNSLLSRMTSSIEFKFWLNHFGVPENPCISDLGSEHRGATLSYLNEPKVIRVPELGDKTTKPRVMWATWNINNHYSPEYLEELFFDPSIGKEKQQSTLALENVTATQCRKASSRDLKLKRLRSSQVDLVDSKEIPVKKNSGDLKKLTTKNGKKKGKKSSKDAGPTASQPLLDKFFGRDRKIGSSQVSEGKAERPKSRLNDSVVIIEDDDEIHVVSAKVNGKEVTISPTPAERVPFDDIPRLFGASKVSEVRDSLSWHISRFDPDPDVAKAINDHFGDLVDRFRISEVETLAKCIFKEIELMNETHALKWIEFYDGLRDDLSRKFSEQFGSALSLPSFR